MKKILFIFINLVFVLCCTSCRDRYQEVLIQTYQGVYGTYTCANADNTRDSLLSTDEIIREKEIWKQTANAFPSTGKIHLISVIKVLVDRDIAGEIIEDKDHIDYRKLLRISQGVYIYNLYNQVEL